MTNHCFTSELGGCGLHNDFYEVNGDAIWVPEMDPLSMEPILTARRVRLPENSLQRKLQGKLIMSDSRKLSEPETRPVSF